MSDDEKGFRPKPSRQEAKGDTTTRVSREIIDDEVSRREAKTERLRAARLAKEAANQTAVEARAERLVVKRNRIKVTPGKSGGEHDG